MGHFRQTRDDHPNMPKNRRAPITLSGAAKQQTRLTVNTYGGLKTMKYAMFILIAVTLVLSGAAFAQVDILGPHNLGGHGCATCHTPHTGAQGNGGTDASTGVNYLWGRDFFPNTYQTFGGGTLTTTASYTATDPLFHTAACLSCHDGNVTIVGMTGQSFETVDGKTVPTYLNKDGYSLSNDHPVHVTYDPTSSFNWPGTVDVNGKITWTLSDTWITDQYNKFGHPARFYTVAGTGSYVECSTCHNPHAMNYARQTTGNNTKLYVKTKFFVRGWYDADNANSHSAANWCRSCHYSKSNEYVQQYSIFN